MLALIIADVEDIEIDSPEMFDISDVTFEMPESRSRRVVNVRLRSESDFNLIKFYLALNFYVEKMENEIGIMAESEGEH